LFNKRAGREHERGWADSRFSDRGDLNGVRIRGRKAKQDRPARGALKFI